MEYLVGDIQRQYEPLMNEGDGESTFYCLRADNLKAYELVI
jgi:hypothetical protein